jgi:hypothetical protein
MGKAGIVSVDVPVGVVVIIIVLCHTLAIYGLKDFPETKVHPRDEKEVRLVAHVIFAQLETRAKQRSYKYRAVFDE